MPPVYFTSFWAVFFFWRKQSEITCRQLIICAHRVWRWSSTHSFAHTHTHTVKHVSHIYGVQNRDKRTNGSSLLSPTTPPLNVDPIHTHTHSRIKWHDTHARYVSAFFAVQICNWNESYYKATQKRIHNERMLTQLAQLKMSITGFYLVCVFDYNNTSSTGFWWIRW